MLEHWYKERRALVDFRRGPLGPYFDGFANRIKELGYKTHSGRGILGKGCLFNDFLVEERIADCSSISESLVETFLKRRFAEFRTTSLHETAQNQYRRALYFFLRYLRDIGVVKTSGPRPGETRMEQKVCGWILDRYVRYLREERALAEVTIDRQRVACCAFLNGMGKMASPSQLKKLNVETIEQFLVKHLKDSPENRRNLTSSLRGFLKFCGDRKYTTEDLSGVVPSVPSYRHSSLPRGIEDSALQRMLKVVPRDTAGGTRDYAIMLLMMAYGIRGKSAAELRLEDINWQLSTIRIRAQKGGKEVILPLLEAVGEAIMEYLRHRPSSALREIFLTNKAPIAVFDKGQISIMIRRYMHEAGVHRPGGGSIMLRHSWAIRALAHDTPIKAIADVLGHRYLDTTFIYAKADLKTLRQVAKPWPEGK